jgi:hypothetical protein
VKKIPALLVLWASLSIPALAAAQNAKLDLPDFRSLARDATDSVNISLGPLLLRLCSGLIPADDPDAAATKQLLAGITSIDVRSYQFAKDFAYSGDELASVRRQLAKPGWTPLAQVHNQSQNENVEVYVMTSNDQTEGFALIASQPREITMVNIVGSIKLEDLSRLQKQLHLPKIEPGRDATVATVPPPPPAPVAAATL